MFAVVEKGPLEWHLGIDLGAFEQLLIVLVALREVHSPDMSPSPSRLTDGHAPMLQTAGLVYVEGHPKTSLPVAAYGVPE